MIDPWGVFGPLGRTPLSFVVHVAVVQIDREEQRRLR